MTKQLVFSAVVTKVKIAYVANCPELEVVSQVKTEEDALRNLREAVELYLEDEDIPKMLKKHSVKPTHLTLIAVNA